MRLVLNLLTFKFEFPARGLCYDNRKRLGSFHSARDKLLLVPQEWATSRSVGAREKVG